MKLKLYRLLSSQIITVIYCIVSPESLQKDTNNKMEVQLYGNNRHAHSVPIYLHREAEHQVLLK